MKRLSFIVDSLQGVRGLDVEGIKLSGFRCLPHPAGGFTYPARVYCAGGVPPLTVDLALLTSLAGGTFYPPARPRLVAGPDKSGKPPPKRAPPSLDSPIQDVSNFTHPPRPRTVAEGHLFDKLPDKPRAGRAGSQTPGNPDKSGRTPHSS